MLSSPPPSHKIQHPPTPPTPLFPSPQALHYKELEFVSSAPTAIEALIHINNQLRQPEAAVGVLTYAQKHLAMELKESWYEKLCR